MKPSTVPVLLIGSSETCPDIEYATGFRAVDPVVFLQAGARKYLVVPELEMGRATRSSPGVEILSARLLGLFSPRKRRRLSEWALALLHRVRVRRVMVPAFFPHGVAERLQQRGIRVIVAAEEIFPSRAVKTPREIRCIRETQQAAVIAVRAAIAQIAAAGIDRQGFLALQGRRLTAEDVQRTIARVLLDHDCMPGNTIVAGGMQAVDPHETGHGPLRAHEAIVIDIFPRHQKHGYWGDLTRTVVKGEAPSALRNMYQAVKAAHAAALNRLHAGAMADRIHRAVVGEFERRGFRTEVVDGRGSGFTHGTGHGVGLEVHEAPSIGLAHTRLRTGHIVTIEPGLYYPGLGGIRIEDTVVVTPTGWRYLVPCEKRFEV